jgi:hypothetical protein
MSQLPCHSCGTAVVAPVGGVLLCGQCAQLRAKTWRTFFLLTADIVFKIGETVCALNIYLQLIIVFKIGETVCALNIYLQLYLIITCNI